jgi:hypothetical protein
MPSATKEIGPIILQALRQSSHNCNTETPETPETPETLDTLDTVNSLDSSLSDTPTQ